MATDCNAAACANIFSSTPILDVTCGHIPYSYNKTSEYEITKTADVIFEHNLVSLSSFWPEEYP